MPLKLIEIRLNVDNIISCCCAVSVWPCWYLAIWIITGLLWWPWLARLWTVNWVTQWARARTTPTPPATLATKRWTGPCSASSTPWSSSPTGCPSCSGGTRTATSRGSRGECWVELQTEVHTKVCNHGEGPYWGLLLVESGFYRFHIWNNNKTLF